MACLLALASTSAPGAPGAGDTSTQPTGVRLQATVVHLPYTSSERLGAVVLNREHGQLAGAGLQLGMDLPAGRLDLDLQRASGTLDYHGFTQFGMPLQTRTRLRMDRAGLAVSPAWFRATLAAGALSAQVGLQQLHIDRRIEPTAVSGRLREQLRLDLLAVGMRWQPPLAAGTGLHLDLHWLQPVGAALRVDSGGVLDTHTLRPRRQGWPAAELVLQRPLGRGLSARIGLRLEQPQIGSAPPVVITRDGLPVGVSAYPGSRQRWHGLAVGLHWQP